MTDPSPTPAEPQPEALAALDRIQEHALFIAPGLAVRNPYDSYSDFVLVRATLSSLLEDQKRMEMLEAAGVDKVYFNDGREITCRTMTLRAAIDCSESYIQGDAARTPVQHQK